VVTNSGGSSTQLGAAIAGLNVGALFAPIWGWAADRSMAYRAIFFSGFMLIAAGFLGFTVMRGFGAWLVSAFLVGFGTGASNTVASLFVVEFTPESEWSQRISWLQTFNALGAILGMAIAGLLQPAFGTFVAALLVIPAIIVGGQGIWPLLSVASNDLAAELAPIGKGTRMGLFNAAAAAASALGAITGGAVADRFGYESVNVFAAAGALLSLLWVLPLRNAPQVPARRLTVRLTFATKHQDEPMPGHK
jgi:MFS family permease